MAQASIDNNNVKTILAYNETTGLAEPIQVATASGRLLLDITVVTTSTPGTIPGVRDQNFVPGLLCVETDTDTISPFIIDSRNGLLYVDVLVE